MCARPARFDVTERGNEAVRDTRGEIDSFVMESNLKERKFLGAITKLCGTMCLLSQLIIASLTLFNIREPLYSKEGF